MPSISKSRTATAALTLLCLILPFSSTADCELPATALEEMAADLIYVANKPAARQYLEKNSERLPVACVRAIFENEHFSTPKRSGAANLLGAYGTDEALQALAAQLRKACGEKAISADELEVATWALKGLGISQRENALELLLDIIGAEYWKSCGGGTPCPEREFGGERTQHYLRSLALMAFAESGTEFAIKTLALGDRIPKDLEPERQGALSLAVYRNQNIWNIPDDIRTLGPEVSGAFFEKWKEIETKYGYKWKTPE